MRAVIHRPHPPAAPQQETVTALSLAALLEHLHATTAGLSTDEAARRLAQYGSNALPEKHISPFVKFLTAFWGRFPG
jgi:H+-transporting ATPase